MRIILVLLLAIYCACIAAKAGQKLAAEREQIEAVISNWDRGWEEKNPKLAAQDYAEDADWINAFGMAVKGRGEIEQVLARVFSYDFVMAGETTTVEQDIRFTDGSTALVLTYRERTGQRNPDGSPLGTRKITHLRVFVRSEGEWKIVSHLISDARDRETGKQ